LCLLDIGDTALDKTGWAELIDTVEVLLERGGDIVGAAL
jgi:hypothetical protein